MPEGPMVRKYADALEAALTGRAIVSLEARTKDARKWLAHNEDRLRDRRVVRVVSHGKHLIDRPRAQRTSSRLFVEDDSAPRA